MTEETEYINVYGARVHNLKRENGEIYRGTDHRPDSPGLSG